MTALLDLEQKSLKGGIFCIEAQASFDFDSNQQSLYKEWRDDLTQIQFFGGPTMLWKDQQVRKKKKNERLLKLLLALQIWREMISWLSLDVGLQTLMAAAPAPLRFRTLRI